MVVLKVYDFTGNGEAIPITLDDNRCYCTHNSDGEDQLVFELQRKSDDYVYISEEVLIEGFGNRFVVKKVEEQSDFVIVTCNLDFGDWLDTIYVNFRKTNVTLPQAIQFILPSGWIVSYGDGVDITKHTTVEYQEGQAFRATNAKTILGAISEAFGVVFNYDMLANELKVININSYLPSGDYFIEDLNMSNLKFTGNSSSIVTKLYVYGKKDERTGEYLTIASVNDGKEYLEDYTYTDKVIVDSVVDERYTVPQNLKEYGQSVLAEKCIPSRSYSFDVSNIDGTIYLYKVVTIVDSRRKLRINHQCVKYIEYKNHSLDKITLSSITPSIGGMLNSVSSNQVSASNRVQAMNDTIQTMENLIIGTGGNFKWVLNSSGDKKEFLILVDSDSIGTATKLFKLDNTGLYYSSTGYDGEYVTLISQDGLITGGGTSYSGLQGKPSIEGVTLDGNKTFANLGLQGLSNSEIDAAVAATQPPQAGIHYLDNVGVNYLYNVVKQYADSLVTSGIPDGGVSTAKLADGAVTEAKISTNFKNNVLPISFESQADFESKIYGGSSAIMLVTKPYLFVGQSSWSQSFIGSSSTGRGWGICFCYSNQTVYCLYMYGGDLYRSIWSKPTSAAATITTKKIPSATWT